MTEPSKPRNFKEALKELDESISVLEHAEFKPGDDDLIDTIDHSLKHLRAGLRWLERLGENF